MKIPKRFKGHAAYHLRSLLKFYKPPTKVEVMQRVYDPTDDGPEIDIIKFFQMHPEGKRTRVLLYIPITRCIHLCDLN